MRKTLRTTVFALIGATVGTVLALIATFGIVQLLVAFLPSDPSAAGARDVCIILALGGLALGASIGADRAKSG